MNSEWISPAAWTAGTAAAGWIGGRVLAAVLGLGRHAGTPSWTGLLAETVRSRLPFWGLLVGAWASVWYWAIDPQARMHLGQAIGALLTVSVTLALASLASRTVERYGAALAPALPATALTRNIAWVAVVLTGALVVLNGLGVSITPMLTALGVGGLAVALALQEPLSNFFAGFFLSLAGQIRVGDYVRLDSGEEGFIADVSWRSTRIQALANNLIIVPNSRLATAIVTNHHLPSPDLAVLVQVGVHYDSDLAHVEAVVSAVGREVMEQVPGGVPSFTPFVRYHTFGESSIDFTAILRATDAVARYLVIHEFVKRLHVRFKQEGIVIPFPIRTVQIDARGAELAASTTPR